MVGHRLDCRRLLFFGCVSVCVFSVSFPLCFCVHFFVLCVCVCASCVLLSLSLCCWPIGIRAALIFWLSCCFSFFISFSPCCKPAQN